MRKVIQLCKHRGHSIIAACDDGTLWMFSNINYSYKENKYTPEWALVMGPPETNIADKEMPGN